MPGDFYLLKPNSRRKQFFLKNMSPLKNHLFLLSHDLSTWARAKQRKAAAMVMLVSKGFAG